MNAAVQNNIFILNRDSQECQAPCAACSKAAMCPASGASTQRVIRTGKSACAAGDNFEGIYLVRSGFFKSYTIEADGTLQITGFYLPGECFGMDAIENGTHREYVEALNTSSVCKISAEAFNTGAIEKGAYKNFSPQLMISVMKMMSSAIARDHRQFFNLGKMSARQRLGNFLLDLSQRMARSGYSGQAFSLCMSRTDIANYLCLALETVSRLFTQLHAEGIIAVDRREIRILNKEALADDERDMENMRRSA